MSALARSRPTARGAALRFLAGLIGFAFPFVTHATTLSPAAPAGAHGDNVLTLYSEPGLRGRHATYRDAAHDVEHQGFTARSAASTGMWTLCEGGEVASRCQTVEGEARELKLSPQIVRPGLNALALYDQPGLKGSRVIYSFAADRPAPFHARSARTWGGPWALCDRGYKHCQALEGTTRNLDLVVAAVRPAPEAADTDPAPVALPVAAKTPLPKPHPPKTTPVASHPKQVKAAAPVRPRLIHVAASRPKPVRPAPAPVHLVHAWRPSHIVHAPLFTPVRERSRTRHGEVFRPLHEARPVRFEPSYRRAPRARLVREIADRHSRHARPVRHRLYRHVRLAWGDGGGDPYLYRYAPAPAFWGPPPRW